MNITELTEHQIRNWPAERVKVFVDSGEYDPWDLSPLHTEVKELGACDYRSNCERYAVLRFRSIDELIVSMSHEQNCLKRNLNSSKLTKLSKSLWRRTMKNLLLASTIETCI